MPPGPPGHPGMHGLPPPGMGMPPHMMPPRPGIILIPVRLHYGGVFISFVLILPHERFC